MGQVQSVLHWKRHRTRLQSTPTQWSNILLVRTPCYYPLYAICWSACVVSPMLVLGAGLLYIEFSTKIPVDSLTRQQYQMKALCTLFVLTNSMTCRVFRLIRIIKMEDERTKKLSTIRLPWSTRMDTILMRVLWCKLMPFVRAYSFRRQFTPSLYDDISGTSIFYHISVCFDSL